MNSQGDCVGHGRPTSGLKRAFLYTDENGLKELNLLIDPAANCFLIAAQDINDSRRIVGYGLNNDMGEHAFCLMPSETVGFLAHLAFPDQCRGRSGIHCLGHTQAPAAGRLI